MFQFYSHKFAKIEIFMAEEIELTLEEQINRAIKEGGRKQTWVVGKMVEAGIVISEVQFSRKKKGDNDEFDDKELTALNNILNTDFKK